MLWENTPQYGSGFFFLFDQMALVARQLARNFAAPSAVIWVWWEAGGGQKTCANLSVHHVAFCSDLGLV